MFANPRSKIFLTAMLVMILACLVVTQVFGMGITEPSPRTADENEEYDMSVAPCGEIAKGPTTVTYTAGANITVKWEIEEDQANGGGVVNFFLMDSDNDKDPVPLGEIVIESDQYETNFTLPEGVTCDNCTLQWVFTPAAEEDEEMSLYQCADIEIRQKNPSTGGGGGNGNGNGDGDGDGDLDSGADTLYSLAPWALAAVGAFVINILA